MSSSTDLNLDSGLKFYCGVKGKRLSDRNYGNHYNFSVFSAASLILII